MCDYSLHCVASRPAKVGDKLTTTSFAGTSTRGFAAVGEPNVAVCLLPGTEIVFEREAEYEHAFRRLLPGLRLGRLGHSVARFRQINTEQSHAHHDALEFPDGRVVLVTRLRPGQRATVIQLPASGQQPQQRPEKAPAARHEHDPLGA
jgi:hypothetical protein